MHVPNHLGRLVPNYILFELVGLAVPLVVVNVVN
jgi:hypothetical protein